jgi:hypothetical protein
MDPSPTTLRQVSGRNRPRTRKNRARLIHRLRLSREHVRSVFVTNHWRPYQSVHRLAEEHATEYEQKPKDPVPIGVLTDKAANDW